jgi:hypothetical protein
MKAVIIQNLNQLIPYRADKAGRPYPPPMPRPASRHTLHY